MTRNEEETSSVGDFKETVVKETTRVQYFFLLQIGVQATIITELNICWKENFVDINKR